MPTNNDDDERCTPCSLTAQQLAAFENGWGVKIMPALGGWKICYFSQPSFESEPGTLFPTMDDALDAVRAVLPIVNAPAERERARNELEYCQSND